MISCSLVNLFSWSPEFGPNTSVHVQWSTVDLEIMVAIALAVIFCEVICFEKTIRKISSYRRRGNERIKTITGLFFITEEEETET